MTNDNARRSALQQLIEDDVVGQLRRRDGLIATLGSEDGVLKLDWVEGVLNMAIWNTVLFSAVLPRSK